MQISNFPFLSGPGFLSQPQSGSRQQVNTDLQVKARAQGAPEGAVAAKPTARVPSSGGPPSTGHTDGPAGLATANSLDQAVRALAADDRLPRRGSLIDLKA